MPTDTRTFIVSNLHRDETQDTNNEVAITLPDSIFSGKVEAINMKQMFIDYSVETLGTSNYEFYLQYPETASPVLVKLDIRSSSSSLVQTDDDLASLIASSMNSAIGNTIFQVYYNPIIIASDDIYRDNSDLLSSYTIFTNNNTNFVLDFSTKASLGPLIGFGNGVYKDKYSYKGGNIPPISAYESIHISNKAYDTIFKEYNVSSDVACKMDLYDSSNTLIPNYLDPRDTTISLPIANGYIRSIHEFEDIITTELNRYSSFFAGNPVFSIQFDLETYKFSITTDKNVKFGIGFRFYRSDGSNNYGSLHRQLGFNKRIYLGYTTITSISSAKIFERAYISEYIFVCSDLIKYNYDTNLIVAESQGASSMYESLFTIPISQITNSSYVPTFENEHRVRIHASRLAKLYNENKAAAKTLTFYLKLSSGRHIKMNTQWSIKFEIEYIN
jgi:hypothetical protein